MVAYVHIEYSTYQFYEESKGDWNPTPPRYRKKRGPGRVKSSPNDKAFFLNIAFLLFSSSYDRSDTLLKLSYYNHDREYSNI